MRKLILIFTFIYFTLTPRLQAAPDVSFYSAGNFNWAGTLSDSEFYKGGNDWGFGLDLGFKFYSVGFEILFKKFDLENTHESSGSTFLVTLSDTLFGFGLRFNYMPGLDIKLGMVSQTIESSYEVISGDSELGNLITGTFTGFYVGVGAHDSMFLDELEWVVETAYYHGSERIAILTMEFGVRYHFFSL